MVVRIQIRPANVLELRTPKMRCFLGSSTKFSWQLLLWNANRWMLKNFKQPFFYNTNGCLWMDEKKVTDNWVTASKMSKYGPEITPYLDTFQAVSNWNKVILVPNKWAQEMYCSCFIFQNIFENEKWSFGLSMLISKFQCQDFLMALKSVA